MTTQATPVSATTTDDTADVLLTVRELISNELSVELDTVDGLCTMKELPGADSVKLLRVVAKLERKYSLEFADEAIFASVTPADLAALVTSGLAAAA